MGSERKFSPSRCFQQKLITVSRVKNIEKAELNFVKVETSVAQWVWRIICKSSLILSYNILLVLKIGSLPIGC